MAHERDHICAYDRCRYIAPLLARVTYPACVHIDAPVEKVFDYVKDPKSQWDAAELTDKASIAEKKIAPQAGEGSVGSWHRHLLFIAYHGTLTRVYMPSERIVDRSSTGVRWTYRFDADEAGTTLTMEVEVPAKCRSRRRSRTRWPGRVRGRGRSG